MRAGTRRCGATADSSVAVTPGASNDISKLLGLGLVWGGTEVSGSAPRRPANVAASTPAGAFVGGSDGSAVTVDDIVPTGGSRGIFALDQLDFPRFNILCLPGVTATDGVEVGEALSYCENQRAFLIVPAQAMVAQFAETFRDFPPRQKPSSFSVDEVMASMSRAHGG